MTSSGTNLVMTVIGFTVSTMFIVFVCTRLICARIQLISSRRSFAISSRSDLSMVSSCSSLIHQYLIIFWELIQMPVCTIFGNCVCKLHLTWIFIIWACVFINWTTSYWFCNRLFICGSSFWTFSACYCGYSLGLFSFHLFCCYFAIEFC